jgi:hypothetical protein
MGWWAESRPIRFTFGASDLRNVVLIEPHGIYLAVNERISPPFAGFPVGQTSMGFNSMRIVCDKAAARAFYEEKLGFGLYFDSLGTATEPAYSNFGVPIAGLGKVNILAVRDPDGSIGEFYERNE